MTSELTVYRQGEIPATLGKNPTIDSARASSGYTCPACSKGFACDQMDGWVGNKLIYKLHCNHCKESWTVTKTVPVSVFNGSDVFEQNKFVQEAYRAVQNRVYQRKLDFMELNRLALDTTPVASVLVVEDSDPIHSWFGLTYASYLVLPRSILQSLPLELQNRLVKILDEVQEYWPDDAINSYSVNVRDKKGRFIKDPYAQYRHVNLKLKRKV